MTKKRRSYNAFMKSDFWKAQRKRVFIRDGYRCTFIKKDGERCECKFKLQAHHKTYNKDCGGIKTVPDSKIITLCKTHHDITHATQRII